MKIFALTFFFLISLKSVTQSQDSAHASRAKANNSVAPDSATIALDIVVDSTGKFVSATYAPASSTTKNEKMIEVATRKASQLKYPARKERYKLQVMFHFKIE